MPKEILTRLLVDLGQQIEVQQVVAVLVVVARELRDALGAKVDAVVRELDLDGVFAQAGHEHGEVQLVPLLSPLVDRAPRRVVRHRVSLARSRLSLSCLSSWHVWYRTPSAPRNTSTRSHPYGLVCYIGMM
eukprot:2910415-Prymnesium_polylepis.1